MPQEAMWFDRESIPPEIVSFDKERKHVWFNKELLQREYGRPFSEKEAWVNLYKTPKKYVCLWLSGHELTDVYHMCGSCGRIFNDSGELVADADDRAPYKTLMENDEVNINFCYSDEKGKVDHVKKTIHISGDECDDCFSKRKETNRRSVRLATEKPLEWPYSRYAKISHGKVPKGVPYIPLKKKLLLPESLSLVPIELYRTDI